MKKKISIVVLVLGILALIAGVTMLVLKLTKTPPVSDGDFLVQGNNWTLVDCSSSAGDCGNVVWSFTEIGKGSLTTNDGQNNYDFSWTIDGDRLTIVTDWLYELRNEYTYELDRDKKTLKLTDENSVRTFTGSFDENTTSDEDETNTPTSESSENTPVENIDKTE